MKGNKSEQKISTKLFSLFILAGSSMILIAVPVLVLTFFGFGLDLVFHTKPIFLIIGGLSGFIGGMTNMYKVMKALK